MEASYVTVEFRGCQAPDGRLEPWTSRSLATRYTTSYTDTADRSSEAKPRLIERTHTEHTIASGSWADLVLWSWSWAQGRRSSVAHRRRRPRKHPRQGVGLDIDGDRRPVRAVRSVNAASGRRGENGTKK